MDFDISTGEVVDSDLESVEIFTDDSDQEEDGLTKRTESTNKGVMMAKGDNLWSCDISDLSEINVGNIKCSTQPRHRGVKIANVLYSKVAMIIGSTASFASQRQVKNYQGYLKLFIPRLD